MKVMETIKKVKPVHGAAAVAGAAAYTIVPAIAVPALTIGAYALGGAAVVHVLQYVRKKAWG